MNNNHIETRIVPIKDINKAPYNPRVTLKPGDSQYESLKKSISKFGLVEPPVWNKKTGTLIGGHQRINVLLDLGHTEAQVTVVDICLTQEKALNLALNKIQGAWDFDKLATILDDIIDEPDIDLETTGFDFDEAKDLIAEYLDKDDDGDEEGDPEDLLDPFGETITKPGDMIILGKDPKLQHKLLCGDSTNPEHVKKLMGDERAVLFSTDAPYLVDYDGNNRPKMSNGKEKTPSKPKEKVTWDDSKANPDLYKKFIRVAIDYAITPNAAWYCWYAIKNHMMLEKEWKDVGAFVHCQIVWNKGRGVPSYSRYRWQHETCMFGWIKGNSPPKSSNKKLTTVWSIDPISNKDRPDHPTPKPIEIFTIPIRQHTVKGDVIYEPFSGSGTQFLSAQKESRRCLGLELDPKYCDLIVRRFIKQFGEGSVSPDIAERYRVQTHTQVEKVPTNV